MKHITVLQTEAIEALNLNPQSVVIDATYGGGGHGRLICEQLGSQGIYIGIDADETAFSTNPIDTKKFKPEIHLIHSNFAKLDEILSSLHINSANAILADLGWRTDQFTDGNKGFSFQSEEPLFMTYGNPESYLFTAYDLVNDWEEENIANVLYGYGDERHSRRIARAIVIARQKKPIELSNELASIIADSLPKFRYQGGIHPATKSFQAIRIAVNDELKSLERFLEQSANHLAPEGRLVVISFHSIEDRIVKLKFKELAETGEFKILTKKPIIAGVDELKSNPRARSAKLRIIEKIEIID